MIRKRNDKIKSMTFPYHILYDKCNYDKYTYNTLTFYTEFYEEFRVKVSAIIGFLMVQKYDT